MKSQPQPVRVVRNTAASFSYGFAPAFEVRLVNVLARNPGALAALVGLRPDGFATPAARTTVAQILVHSDETGQGPRSKAAVLGRVHALVTAGKATSSEYDAALDLLDPELDDPADDHDLIAVAAATVRRVHTGETIGRLAAAYAARQDIDDLVDDLVRLRATGVVADHSANELRIGVDCFAGLDHLAHYDSLSLGVAELDLATGGGLARRGIGLFAAESGCMKSMSLSNAAVSAYMTGLQVAVASTELDEAFIAARVLANVTGVPTNDILAARFGDARRVLAGLLERFSFGAMHIKRFSFGTRPVEILDWFRSIEDRTGMKVDVGVVDHMDRMSPNRTHREASSYRDQGEIIETLREWALDREAWMLTASQCAKGSQAEGPPRGDQIADSAQKLRTADLVITQKWVREDRAITYHIAKNRRGEDGQILGPFVADPERGRMLYATDPVRLAAAQILTRR